MTAIIALSACAGGGTQQAQADAGAADVDKAIAAAKAADKKANSLQGSWVSTGKLIKKAEKAKAAGKNDEALKLAKKAQKEAELAYKQAEYESKHWSPPPYAIPK
ncbi:MAG: SoxXA-binding protein [Gammaproteobacteria bacterium]|nr:MAG: SoxXA-binding protein [Gammaproteobacteria bacterium]